ncbi:TniQ family protein [Shinella sp. H4-D48]|uniref:TniQ family protein n=1 Tax=Shinella sp. H4-D48 TaxID=2925841 RepID=UPI001F5346BD|nr:TniQ family protein [Shinella sp. H4-D48]UNK39133.1 TniQ family protein [Shinella sp. H4-D48]
MNVSPSIYLPFSNWSLKPLLGESARGYFLRLVANEGHYSASVYGNEIGINGRRLTPEETLDTLLTLPIGDEHKAALRLYSPLADGSFYNLGGQRLRQRQMVFSTRRFCRACLAVSPHHRVWWDICAFRTCPEHGTPIEDVDASGQPIGWWWAEVGSDTSGRLLARCAPSQADRHDRTLEAFILERLGVLPQTRWPLLDGYHLYEVIETCEYLGMWLGNERTFTAPADQLGKMAVGMAALSGTWQGLVSAMRGWFTERVPSDVRREGKMESMAWAWNAWPKLPGSAIGDMLKRATTEAFEPIGKMGKKRFRTTRAFYAEKALSKVAGELDVKMDALLPLARHLHLIPDTDEAWMLSPDGASVLKRAVADLVPYPLASEIIGFATWEWRELVGNDVIRAFSQFADGSMYLRKDIENVVGRMIRKATVSDSMTISIRTYARHNRMTVGNVLMRILDGQLAAARGCGKQRGLRNLRIVASNRRQRSARLPSGASVQNAMTVADAAIILRLHHEVVALLVRDGRLEKAHGGMVARSSVMDFHARYANGQLYRPALGCASSEVRDRLSKIGLSVECLGDRVANVVVLREAARRALELEFDPDDRHVARNVLWEEFRTLAIVRCPVFTVPPTVPEVGVKLRTATRKIAVSASVDRSSGAVSLTFDLHPELTGRRWKLFEKSEADVRQALGFMSWNKMADNAGWRLSWVAEDLVGVRLAVDALVGMHRWFK